MMRMMKVLTLLGASTVAAIAVAAPQTLPFAVYEDGLSKLAWIPSGYMGDTGAIVMDDKATSNPHAGATCLKVEFRKNDGWGGVVWVDPANDWGDKTGGYDLTGAKKLSFWARGAAGGEKVKFGYGIIKSHKPSHDSSSGEHEAALTTDWKQYEIDLAGKDLKNIKTGFYWVLGGQGSPLEFYLDDVRYE